MSLGAYALMGLEDHDWRTMAGISCMEWSWMTMAGRLCGMGLEDIDCSTLFRVWLEVHFWRNVGCVTRGQSMELYCGVRLEDNGWRTVCSMEMVDYTWRTMYKVELEDHVWHGDEAGLEDSV